MDAGIVIGFVAVGVIGLANILAMAFFFGKLKQKVDDLWGRVTRLEDIQDSKNRNARRKAGAKA